MKLMWFGYLVYSLDNYVMKLYIKTALCTRILPRYTSLQLIGGTGHNLV